MKQQVFLHEQHIECHLVSPWACSTCLIILWHFCPCWVLHHAGAEQSIRSWSGRNLQLWQVGCGVSAVFTLLGGGTGNLSPMSGLCEVGPWAQKVPTTENIFLGSQVRIVVLLEQHPGNIEVKSAKYWGILCLLRVNESTALKLIEERGTEHSAHQWDMVLLEYFREKKERDV